MNGGVPTNSDYQQWAVDDILTERSSQDAQWGVQNHEPLAWQSILLEEVGELAHVCTQANVPPAGAIDAYAALGFREMTKRELTQIAAVALAWLEAIYREETEGGAS